MSPPKSILTSSYQFKPSKCVTFNLPSPSKYPSIHLPNESPQDKRILNRAHDFYHAAFDEQLYNWKEHAKGQFDKLRQSNIEELRRCEHHYLYQIQELQRQMSGEHLKKITALSEAHTKELDTVHQAHKEYTQKLHVDSHDELFKHQLLWRQEVKDVERLSEQKMNKQAHEFQHTLEGHEEKIKQLEQEKTSMSQAWATEKAEMQAQITALSHQHAEATTPPSPPTTAPPSPHLPAPSPVFTSKIVETSSSAPTTPPASRQHTKSYASMVRKRSSPPLTPEKPENTTPKPSPTPAPTPATPKTPTPLSPPFTPIKPKKPINPLTPSYIPHKRKITTVITINELFTRFKST